MSWAVPPALEEIVYAAARAVVGDAALATSPLVRAIVDRSKRYTSERDRLSEASRGDLAARAVFFTLADCMKIRLPLAELAARGAMPGAAPLRVVDLGAGCGALSLGLIAALERGAGVELTLVDRDGEALRIAAAAVATWAEACGVACRVTVRAADASGFAIPPADLVMMGSVLNELAPAARVPLVAAAVGAIGRDGAVIVVEPALRETARALHEVRDAMIDRASAAPYGAAPRSGEAGPWPTAHVVAPCTRRVAPCTALVDERDWCHEDRPLALPPRTADLARITHLRDSGMKFAYLVLRAEPIAIAGWRLVSAPMPAKGKWEVTGCADAGRVPLRLLKRNKTGENRAFERADRGDIVVTAAPVEAGRVELAGAVEVVRVRGER
ncbi:MAG TPA: small ribosomal subunit Rsm22 family protein [Kofleriaceae bacterium]